MKILIVGAGVIGTVYGAHLGASGHKLSVLAHGTRTEAVARDGLSARDVTADVVTEAPASVVRAASEEPFDLVLVALRRDHLSRAADQLSTLAGRPLVLFFANNPSGKAGLPREVPGTTCMGFPGIGGAMEDGRAEYAPIAQQPTTIDDTPDPRLREFKATLEHRGFNVQSVSNIEGWLTYHAVFVTCIAAALEHCENDPQRLAGDRGELRLMCQAIAGGFSELRRQGVTGLPGNLAVLHSRLLLPFAVRYWARSMRSPMGELAFAAHARHAQPEMHALATDVLARVTKDTQPTSLIQLLKSNA
jgi:2-dehydropantoate 2-reductase